MDKVVFRGEDIDRVAVFPKSSPDAKSPQQRARERKLKDGIRQLQLEMPDIPEVRESLKAAGKLLSERPEAAPRLLAFVRDCIQDERITEDVETDILPDVAWQMIARLNDRRTRQGELEIQGLAAILRERPDLRDAFRRHHAAPIDAACNAGRGIPDGQAAEMASLVTSLVTHLQASVADLNRDGAARIAGVASVVSKVEQSLGTLPELDRKLADSVSHLASLLAALGARVDELRKTTDDQGRSEHASDCPISPKLLAVEGGVQLLNELVDGHDAAASLPNRVLKERLRSVFPQGLADWVLLWLGQRDFARAVISATRRAGSGGMPVVLPRSRDLARAAEQLSTLEQALGTGAFARLCRAVCALCDEPDLSKIILAAQKSPETRGAVQIAVKTPDAPVLGETILRTSGARRKALSMLCPGGIPSPKIQ